MGTDLETISCHGVIQKPGIVLSPPISGEHHGVRWGFGLLQWKISLLS